MKDKELMVCPACKQGMPIHRIPCKSIEVPLDCTSLSAIHVGWWQCAECLLVFKSPRPSEEQCKDYYSKSPAYEGDFYSDRWRDTKSFILSNLRNWGCDYSEWVGLDVGSKDGRALSELGIHGSSIDPSPKGSTVSSGWLESDSLPGPGEQLYNFIVASHVLEHAADPSGFLRAIRHRIAPGGWAYVEVPSLERPCDELIQKAHLQAFSVPGVIRCADAAGLKVAAIETSYSAGLGVIRTLLSNRKTIIQSQNRMMTDRAMPLHYKKYSSALDVLRRFDQHHRKRIALYGASEALAVMHDMYPAELDGFAGLVDLHKEGEMAGYRISRPYDMFRGEPPNADGALITPSSPNGISTIRKYLRAEFPDTSTFDLFVPDNSGSSPLEFF